MPKTVLFLVGKTISAPLNQMIDDYVGRIVHFTPFNVEVVPELKNAKSLTQEQQKTMEGKALLAKLKPGDHVVLLDEHGRQYSSLDFARYVTQKQHLSSQRVVYVVGGPYGFSREVYDRANDKLSLSSMTFSHQMIRLLFVEQYYRALTIINHLPYHHE